MNADLEKEEKKTTTDEEASRRGKTGAAIPWKGNDGVAGLAGGEQSILFRTHFAEIFVVCASSVPLGAPVFGGVEYLSL